VPITHNDKFQAHNNNNVARIDKSSCFGVKSESYSILVGYSYKGVGAKPTKSPETGQKKEIPRRLLRLSTSKVQSQSHEHDGVYNDDDHHRWVVVVVVGVHCRVNCCIY
jgi:hypothetical protein